MYKKIYVKTDLSLLASTITEQTGCKKLIMILHETKIILKPETECPEKSTSFN